MLRRVLHGNVTRRLFGSLPPAVGDRMAKAVSRTGHKWDVYTEGHLARSAALETWAVERLAAERDLEMIILGHTHVPLLKRTGSNRWYANTGDWVVHRSYLRLERGCDPVLVRSDGSAT
jgi:UDP-2,3-diacylglucosamine pyrophosphatase LpxH